MLNINFRYLLFILFVSQILGLKAQTPLTIANHWIFINVTVSHQEASHNVQGLIDTGASICLIDSTFAVDSCHIKIALSNATIGNTSGKRINSFSINLDSISMGDRIYSNVCCYLVDLAGKLKQYAPKFIIGGDVLKKDLWCFDLNQNVMKRYDTVPANSKRTLSWKNHEDYSDAALNSIYLEGKISGKKTRIFFDTGSRKNELPEYFKVLPTKDIEIESANIADKLTLKEEKLCENTPVEIAEDKYLVNFFLTSKAVNKYPRMNTDFLLGKIFLLNYKKKCLYVFN